MRLLTIAVLLFVPGFRLTAQTDTRAVRIGGLVFIAHSAITDRGRVLRTVVRATNQGRDTVRLTTAGDCPVAVRVAREFRGTIFWDGTQHRGMCYGLERVTSLAPGRDTEFVQRDSVSRWRSERRNIGPYFFSAVLRISGGMLEIPSGRDGLPE